MPNMLARLTKKRLIAGVIGVAALGFGIVGVQAATSPSPSTGKNYAQVFVDKLAGILHLSSSQTQDALKQAQLQTIDQMVKDGQITQAQADAIKARINAGQGLLLPRFEHPGFHRDRALFGQLKTAELNALAKSLSMSTSDLMTQLRSGKTITDLENAKGVSDSSVRAALKQAARGVLDPAVKAGTITQAQEDMILQGIDNGRFGFKHRHFGGGAPEPREEGTPAPSGSAL